MSIQQKVDKDHKLTYDDMNPRIYHEEWRCRGCKKWFDADEVIWATLDGQLNTDTGDPYCDNCVPAEDEMETDEYAGEYADYLDELEGEDNE